MNEFLKLGRREESANGGQAAFDAYMKGASIAIMRQ